MYQASYTIEFHHAEPHFSHSNQDGIVAKACICPCIRCFNSAMITCICDDCDGWCMSPHHHPNHDDSRLTDN